MDQIVDRRIRIGTCDLPEMDDSVPQIRPGPQKPDTVDGNDECAAAANTQEAGHFPPPRKQTSILQAERQAKIVVLTTALAAWAYFSQDIVSVPDLILTIKHGIGLDKAELPRILSAEQLPAARP